MSTYNPFLGCFAKAPLSRLKHNAAMSQLRLAISSYASFFCDFKLRFSQFFLSQFFSLLLVTFISCVQEIVVIDRQASFTYSFPN